MDQQPGTDDKADVVIIGAGPAVAAAAIVAAQGGLKVLVIDKATFPRPKCCGDGLTANALRELDALGFDPSSIPSWQQVDDVTITSPSGTRRVFPLPRSAGMFAAIARRSELDAELVRMARQAGAQVLEGHELVEIEQDQSWVTATIRAADQDNTIRVRSRILLGADGMWSKVRKLIGVGPEEYRGDWHAFRQYFTNVTDRAQQELMVWFEPDLLPGYAWSFPLGDGSANVGFGILRGAGGDRIQNMKALWPDLLQRPHIREAIGGQAEPEGTHRAWPIPARLGEMPMALGRILFVGDAVAATDPMSGEGIGQALETGRFAIESLLSEGIDHPTAIRDRYESGLRRGMVRDHQLAKALSGLLSSTRNANAALAIVGANDWTRRNFARWLFEDYPRAAALNPRHWRRSTFTAAAAYEPKVPLDT